MKKLIFALSLVFCSFAVNAQTVDTVTTTPIAGMTGINRWGVTVGPIVSQGQSQLLKDLGIGNKSYMPVVNYNNSYACGGGTQTTTSWEVDANGGSTGYPANFFVGATYNAIAQTGAILGTGTITASSSNTSGNLTFTLSNAMTAACTTGSNTALVDYLLVYLPSTANGQVTSRITPLQEYGSAAVTSSFSWSTDAPTGQSQSLLIPNGGTFNSYPEQAIAAILAGGGYNVVYDTLNGSYNQIIIAKCATAGCTISYAPGRLGSTAFTTGTISPSATAWNTYTIPFTANETRTTPANTNLNASISCSGSGGCLVAGDSIVEGSSLSGNTTKFRDAVVHKLQQLKPGVIRFMNPGDWCTTVADLIAPDNQRGVCDMYATDATKTVPTIGATDDLELSLFINADAYISLGKGTRASDMALWMAYLGDSNCADAGAAQRCAAGHNTPWTTTFAAAGLHIYTEMGNEAWNTVNYILEGGNGKVYGALIGPLITAHNTSSFYNSSVEKIVMNGQQNGGGNGGFSHNALQAWGGCSPSTPAGCPDGIELANYLFNNWANTTNTFQDQIAEDANYNPGQIFGGGNSYQTAKGNQFAELYNQANWGTKVHEYVYEMNYQVNGASISSPTQLQAAQTFDSVGAAIGIAENMVLMRSQSNFVGPINEFSFDDYIAWGYSGLSVNFGSWESWALLQCGPGLIASCPDADYPIGIAMRLLNNTVLPNWLTSSQTSNPTLNYAGGQGGSIAANSSVNLTPCYTTTDGANNFTKYCFNNDSSSHTITHAGAGSPISSTSVTRTVFGGPTNAVTDNNDNINLTSFATTTPAVVYPSSTVITGTSDTLPANSMVVYQYMLGGSTPTAATPVITPSAGTYTTSQTISITCSTPSSVIYYTRDGSTPTTSSTVYAGSFVISASETDKSICTATGYLTSAVASNTYTINLPTAATPTASPVAGSYVGAQSIVLNTSTSGANIYYTTDGSTPTTGSLLYGGPIVVTTSETIKAIAAYPGNYLNSSVGSFAYIITSGTCSNYIVLTNNQIATVLISGSTKIAIQCK